jgi:hypothetical protein
MSDGVHGLTVAALDPDDRVEVLHEQTPYSDEEIENLAENLTEAMEIDGGFNFREKIYLYRDMSRTQLSKLGLVRQDNGQVIPARNVDVSEDGIS